MRPTAVVCCTQAHCHSETQIAVEIETLDPYYLFSIKKSSRTLILMKHQIANRTRLNVLIMFKTVRRTNLRDMQSCFIELQQHETLTAHRALTTCCTFLSCAAAVVTVL